MANIILETKQLSKKYNDYTALHPTNIRLEKGCIYGLVGINGAGKSTLMRLIAGQCRPTSGEIKLFNQAGADLEGVRRRTGVLVEQPAFYPELSGRNNLEYYRIQMGIAEKNSVNQVLKQLALMKIAHKKFKHYSLGNKQRLGLALALLRNPDLLILDEPINGLDPLGNIEMRKLLLELNQKRQITIMISSHILAELETLITRVGVIHKGQLIKELEMSELQEKCQTYIELKVDNSQKAAAILDCKLELTAYKVWPEHIIHIYENSGAIANLSKTLNQHDIAIKSIRSLELSLEDYFIQLIGEKSDD